MDIDKTIEILEILVAGCSPTTGEVLENDSVLNERAVIRALQITIDHLKKDSSRQFLTNVEIDEVDIKAGIELFSKQGKNASASNLVGFFLGTRKFKNENLTSNPLYAKYSNIYSKGQLLDHFNLYLYGNQPQNEEKNYRKNRPYSEIDFFQKEKFNTLSENAIKQLKEKINELGIEKTENLSEYIQNSRISHPRAYEAWSDKEKKLLAKAIKYTNDLDLLSECFQRGKGSIESYGQRIIYESQNQQNNENNN